MSKNGFLGTIFGAMFRNALTKYDKAVRLNHYEATTIQESYAHRSTQKKRRERERRFAK